MDFNDTPEEAAWREECRTWLAEHSPVAPHDDEGGTEDGPAIGSPDYLARAREWQSIKFDGGFAKVTWEPEYGGRGGTVMQQIIFGQEEGRYPLPTAAFMIGIGMIAPTIRACGTEAQKQRYLRPLLRGEEVWCQLFSEPGAGSDVASLSTMAVRDGDEWVLNGQKVWTSGAQFSDFGEIICRTNPDAEKHKGITAFIVDMHAPGITIQPLKQMNGMSSFNEVFFDDVRVPAENMLGDEHDGWRVAIATLMNERVAIGTGSVRARGVPGLIELTQRRGLTGEPEVRQRLAGLYARSRIQRFIGLRSLTAASKGLTPGPEGSIAKLFGAQLYSDLADAAIGLLGPAGVAAADDDWGWHDAVLSAPSAHIAGGSSEIMRNILGERVLGLPGEPRADKGVPWREVPRSV